MNKELEARLLELGFKLKNNYLGTGEDAYVCEIRGSQNRFEFDFVYYADENEIYINCYRMRGLETISQNEILDDHNNLNTNAKYRWTDVINGLKEFDVKIEEV